jgi:hypothetical protein
VSGRIDKQIVSLLACVRAPKHRLAVLSLLGLILLAQTALAVHRIEHRAVAHDTNCTLCLSAGHAAAPAAAIGHPVPRFVAAERPVFTASRPVFLHCDPPYFTRAPPLLRNAV